MEPLVLLTDIFLFIFLSTVIAPLFRSEPLQTRSLRLSVAVVKLSSLSIIITEFLYSRTFVRSF